MISTVLARWMMGLTRPWSSYLCHSHEFQRGIELCMQLKECTYSRHATGTVETSRLLQGLLRSLCCR